MSSDLRRTLTDCSVELRELFSHVADVSPWLSTESPDSDRQTVDDFYTRQARYDIVFVCLSVCLSVIMITQKIVHEFR